MDEDGPSTVWITNEIPDNKPLMEAMGRVAIRHSQLDSMLKYVLKTLSGQSVEVIFKNHAGWLTSRLQTHVREVAARKLSGEPLEKLISILDRCEAATESRNDFVHSFWQAVADSNPKQYRMLRVDGVTISELPTVTELLAVSRELLVLADELNEARRSGFLAKALEKRS
jgi:hypothetical protein